MVRQFASPVDVSILIRFSRWFMLAAGIGYGVYRQNSLQRFENERRRVSRARLNDRNVDRPVFEGMPDGGDDGPSSESMASPAGIPPSDSSGQPDLPPFGPGNDGRTDLRTTELEPTDSNDNELPDQPVVDLTELRPIELPAVVSFPRLSQEGLLPSVHYFPPAYKEYRRSLLSTLYLGYWSGMPAVLLGPAARYPSTPSGGPQFHGMFK